MLGLVTGLWVAVQALAVALALAYVLARVSDRLLGWMLARRPFAGWPRLGRFAAAMPVAGLLTVAFGALADAVPWLAEHYEWIAVPGFYAATSGARAVYDADELIGSPR
jgi:hypothetical protein